jgi:hypothetical protein
MKKRDVKKQAKLQKITTKRAQYEKARQQKIKAGKSYLRSRLPPGF